MGRGCCLCWFWQERRRWAIVRPIHSGCVIMKTIERIHTYVRIKALYFLKHLFIFCKHKQHSKLSKTNYQRLSVGLFNLRFGTLPPPSGRQSALLQFVSFKAVVLCYCPPLAVLWLLTHKPYVVLFWKYFCVMLKRTHVDRFYGTELHVHVLCAH